MTRQILSELTERQLSDETRLRRTVAYFQRQLGAIFGNASVRRRNRAYEIDVAVYEKQVPKTGESYKMPNKQIVTWVKHAADKAHPRLFKRMTVDTLPWQMGRVSHKLFCPLKVVVDARTH